ncbi:MAG: hypothetical protein U9Q99_02040 [Nanoarchaeota archaeon]|nr:hypothetical protein [Nanoarchaeota archaeon]
MKEKIIDLGIAKIKLTPVEEKKIVIIAKCPFCERKIRGSKSSQVEWNIYVHVKQNHKDHKDYKIFLDQLERQNEGWSN